MKRRIVVWLLVVLLGLTACTNSGSGPEPAAGTENVAGDKSTLHVSMTLAAGPKTPDAWVEKALEEDLQAALGRPVDIESIMLPSSEQQTKINLLMSDVKTMPDVIWYPGNMDKEYDNWVRSGVLIDLLPALQKYGQNILSYYSKETLFYSYDKSGRLFRVPGDVAEASSMTTILRKDWMEKLGLEVPKTVDEYIEVLRAFTKNDPDGNGRDDTYGLSGPTEWRSFAPILYAYKSDPEHFMIQPDGTVKYGAVLPQTKQALQILQDMYKEGLIDPRMLSNTDGSKFNEMMQQGKIGSFYRWVDYFNPSGNVIRGFKANNPDGELMHIDPIQGPDGFSSDYPEQTGGWSFISVTSQAKEPDEVVKVLNRIASPETYKLITFGKENEHYVIENGIFKPLITPDESTKLGLGNFGWYVSRKDEANIKNTPEVTALFEKRAITSQPLRDLRIEFKSLDRPAWKEYSTDINTLRDQTFYGIISGKLPIDEFDKFVSQFYQMGGDKMEAEANQLYQDQQKEYAQYEQWYNEQIMPYRE